MIRLKTAAPLTTRHTRPVITLKHFLAPQSILNTTHVCNARTYSLVPTAIYIMIVLLTIPRPVVCKLPSVCLGRLVAETVLLTLVRGCDCCLVLRWQGLPRSTPVERRKPLHMFLSRGRQMPRSHSLCDVLRRLLAPPIWMHIH